MYVTGTRLTFSTRLHQLGGDSAALTSFRTEGSSYVSSVPRQLSGQWEKEARQQQYRFSGVSGLLTNQFADNIVLPNVNQLNVENVIYSQPNFEVYFSASNQNVVHLWTASVANLSDAVFVVNITAFIGDGEYFGNSDTNPNIVAFGEADYFYFTKSYGNGINYSTDAVTGIAFGPVTIGF
jgi:hypothetical protein